MTDPVDSSPAAPVAVRPTPSQKWLEAIAPLTAKLGLSDDDVTFHICVAAKLISAPDDNGAETIVDADAVSDDDFIKAFDGIAKGTVKKAVKEMRNAASPKAEPAQTAPPGLPLPTGAPYMGALYVIPDVPEGEAFLSALSTSKTLTIDAVTIRAALEAVFADSLGLSEIPERLADLMEQHADNIEEPVGDNFMEVLKFVRERRYAEVNVDSRLVTVARKAEVLKRLRQLPGALHQFQAALTAWNEQLKTMRGANPLGVLSGAPTMYPAADDVIGAAEAVVACLKRAFSGLGVMVAKAMAYEGMKIRETLEKPELPALTGSPNRELMLKRLGVEITNADVRVERNVARFVIFVATTVHKNLPGGQEGPVLEALYNLGQTILPWMTSGNQAPTNGRGRSAGSDPHPVGGRRDPSSPYPPVPRG
jgi:hypothetical protein